MSETSEPKEKSNVGKIVCWVCGVLFALCGIVQISGGTVFGGLLMLVGGVLLLPPILSTLEEKAKVKQSVIIIISIVLIILGLMLSGGSDGASDAADELTDVAAEETEDEAEADAETEEQSDDAVETEDTAEGEDSTEGEESSADEAETNDMDAEAEESENAETESPIDTESEAEEAGTSSNVEEIEYDALQSLFLSIEDGLTEESLLSAIAENGLCYSIEEDNTGEDGNFYRIAYTEEVAALWHADLGDSLEVSFLANGDVEKADYFNQSLFVSALYKSSNIESDYGYTDYSYSPDMREDGSNAGTTHMNYYEADSLEEALILALTMAED